MPNILVEMHEMLELKIFENQNNTVIKPNRMKHEIKPGQESRAIYDWDPFLYLKCFLKFCKIKHDKF